jgi:hypothetical protein
MVTSANAIGCHFVTKPPAQKSPHGLFISRFFVVVGAGTPVAALPDIDVGLLGGVGLFQPFARKPDIARMRARAPVARNPHVLTAPFPMAGDEPPLRRRTGRRRDDVLLIGGRRLRRLTDIYAVSRGDLGRDIDRWFAHAAREQWQAGSDQNYLGESRYFHSLNLTDLFHLFGVCATVFNAKNHRHFLMPMVRKFSGAKNYAPINF